MDKRQREQKEQGGRLKAARIAAGFKSARQAAVENNWPESSYRAHEAGKRTIGLDDAERYARVFKRSGASIDAKSILFAPPKQEVVEKRDPRSVRVMGLIGAGGDVEPDFDQADTEGLFEVTLPFAVPDDLIGLVVDGESMLPKFDPGDVIVVWREQRKHTQSFIGELAAVRTENGRRYLKTILTGSKQDLYRLESFNAKPIADVSIQWVGEIHTIVPASQVKKIGSQKRAAANRKAAGRTKATSGMKELI